MKRALFAIGVTAGTPLGKEGTTGRSYPAARLYAERCNECHRVFAPGSLTSAMWEFQVDRMQGEMVRRGFPPLRPDERKLVLDYLRRHSANASSD